MDELTESEALYILRKSYVMTTNHCLDEENIKLKKAIKTIIKINKGRNAKNKKLKERLDQKEQLYHKALSELVIADKRLAQIKKYTDREVDLLTDTIEDYIDDDREGNKDIIGSFKEEREQWKDIQRIINNEEKLYFNLEE